MLVLSFLIALIIRHGSITLEQTIYRTLLFILILADLLAVLFFNAMHDVLKRGYAREFSATFKLVLIVALIATGYMFSTQSGEAYSRLVILYTAILHLILGYSTRLIFKDILQHHGKISAFGTQKRSMLAVLKTSNAEEMVKRLLANPAEAYQLSGIVLDGEYPETEIDGIPIVCSLEDASNYICRQWIDSVYIDVKSEDERIKTLMDDCREMAVPVHYHIPGVSRHQQKQFVERIAGSTVLTLSNNYATPLQLLSKRAMDLIGGIIGSLAALLVIAIIGPIIKHASPGPILYKSERIGQNGRRFISCMSQLMRKRLIFT